MLKVVLKKWNSAHTFCRFSYDLHISIAGVASDIQNESVEHFLPVSGEMPEDIHHMGEHRARQTL